MAQSDEHIDKESLRLAMLRLEAADLETAREHYEAHLADSHMADNEPHENDEMAASVMAADLAHGFEAPMHDHEAKIAALEALDFRPRGDVGPGAVVCLDGRWFVAAVATGRFESQGRSFMGLSLDAPIYRAMEGLQAGDTVTMGNREMTIDAVL